MTDTQKEKELEKMLRSRQHKDGDSSTEDSKNFQRKLYFFCHTLLFIGILFLVLGYKHLTLKLNALIDALKNVFYFIC